MVGKALFPEDWAFWASWRRLRASTWPAPAAACFLVLAIYRAAACEVISGAFSAAPGSATLLPGCGLQASGSGAVCTVALPLPSERLWALDKLPFRLG